VEPALGTTAPGGAAKGSDAIQKALTVGAKSERERDYIAAVARFYADSDKLDHRTRAGAYSDAMEKVYAKYPEDREAAAFYALSMLATADPLDDTYARQREAGKILEVIFREEPNHPAAAHYLIHAYDCGPLAEAARPAAEQYAKSTPYVPHAIHMPSHTYVLLGCGRRPSIPTLRRRRLRSIVVDLKTGCTT
jgi:hypothetical protein